MYHVDLEEVAYSHNEFRQKRQNSRQISVQYETITVWYWTVER